MARNNVIDDHNAIAFDPGKTTGVAYIVEGELKVNELGEGALWEFLYQLGTLEFEVFVIEDYKIRPPSGPKKYMHYWSSVQPAKIIGILEYTAWRIGAESVIQQPAIKPIGYARAGLPYQKGKKGTHWQDAVAHLSYYLDTLSDGAFNMSEYIKNA